MRILTLTALAAAIALLPATAQAGGKSHGGGRGGMSTGGHHGGMIRTGGHNRGGMMRNWGGKHQGRWVGGHRAPGGWNSYRRLGRGYSLPQYWMNSSFFVPNYYSYGFAQPTYGYTWTRYYDDAALVDGYGRIYDYRPAVNWDYNGGYSNGGYTNGGYTNGGGNYGYQSGGSYGSYEDSYGYDERYSGGRRSNSGLGGALAGGAVGAIAGAAIAGRGDRTEGAILGGVGGAMLGGILGSESDRKARKRARRAAEGYGYGYPQQQGGYAYPQGGYVQPQGGYQTGGYDYQASQTGYNPGYGQQAGADYDDGGYGPDMGSNGGMMPPPASPAMPAPMQGGGHHGGGHHGGGYYGYTQPQVTTVTYQPAPVVTTTTSTEYVTEYVSVPARKRVYRKPAPKRVYKAKPRCVCKVVYR